MVTIFSPTKNAFHVSSFNEERRKSTRMHYFPHCRHPDKIRAAVCWYSKAKGSQCSPLPQNYMNATHSSGHLLIRPGRKFISPRRIVLSYKSAPLIQISAAFRLIVCLCTKGAVYKNAAARASLINLAPAASPEIACFCSGSSAAGAMTSQSGSNSPAQMRIYTSCTFYKRVYV